MNDIKIDLIKPCPFCGGEAVLIQTSHGTCSNPAQIKNAYKVGCKKCNIFTWRYESSIWQGEDGVVHIDANGAMDAMEAWNRRTQDAYGPQVCPLIDLPEGSCSEIPNSFQK